MSESLRASLRQAFAEADCEARLYNFDGAYAILRRGYEQALSDRCLSHDAAPGRSGGAGDLHQPAASVSDLREHYNRRSEWSGGCSPATRVAEIRQENAGGDVSYREIEWLCCVASAAIRLAAAGRASRELVKALNV